MQIDRRLVSSFDWPLFVLSIGLALLGIMTIYSATCSVDEECSRYLATKQSYWLVIGMVMMVATFSVDYQRLNRWAYPIYAAVVILLALVLVIGITSGGSQRWLDLKILRVPALGTRQTRARARAGQDAVLLRARILPHGPRSAL